MSASKTAVTIGATIITMAAGMVAYFEGYVPQTYADPVGIPTICYGHTGVDVTPGRAETREGCRALLEKDLAAAYAGVLRCVRVPLQNHQAAALTSFTFNVGVSALCNSTLARLANTGADPAVWCAELDRWVYSRGVRLSGLVKRRAAERAMCEGKQS